MMGPAPSGPLPPPNPAPNALQGQQGAGPGMMHPMAAPAPQTPAAGQAPISPDKLKLLELPTWEEVEALLRNPVHREFRLDIETDSTIAPDEDAEREARMAFLEATGTFLDKAVMAGTSTPQLLPMLGEILMFAVRSFRTARPVEQAFEDALQALQKSASQPKPDPEVQKAQIQAQADITVAQNKAQLDKQVEDAKQQAQAQQNQLEQQLEQARAQHDAQLQASLEQHKAQLAAASAAQIQEMKNHFEAQRVQFEGQVKIHIAQLDSHTKLAEKRMELEHDAHQQDKQREHEKSMPKPKEGEK